MTPKILIVEDENLIRWSLAHVLKENGFEVTMTESGEQALEQFKMTRFDAVITDLELPEMNGLQVASAAKLQSPGIPVIMISDSGKEALSRTGPGNLIDRFVEKPFELKEMVSVLGQLLCGFGVPEGSSDLEPSA